MAESQEPKSERLTVAVTQTEREAVAFMASIHPEYDGDSSVLRDFSVTQCLDAYRRAIESAERLRAGTAA